MAASALSLSSAYKTFVFSEINPVPPIFFHLKSFLWKGPLTVKVRKKIIDQILGYISFCIEIHIHLGHLFAKTPEMMSGKLPPRKIAPRSGSGFGLGLALELGLGGYFPRGQFS